MGGRFEWAGRQWEAAPLPASAAAVVAQLAEDDAPVQMSAVLRVAEAAGIGEEGVLDALWEAEDEPVLLDLAAGVLAVGTARPWRSTVGLSVSTVRQWSTIRGRLIEKGVPDPLRALPSLTALLDVVEVMVLDSFEKDEDRQRWLRELYRNNTTVDAAEPPPGWSDGVEGLDDLMVGG